MKAPSSMRVPTHLYVFCSLGVLGGLLLFFLPLMVMSSFVSEQARFEACHSGTRTDCAPSIFWYLNEWTQEGAETSAPTAPIAATSTQDLVTATSTTSTIALPAAPTSTKATPPSTKRKRK